MNEIHIFLRGSDQDIYYKTVIEELRRKGIVIKIPHRHGDKVFINPEYKFEIERALKKIHPFL